MIAPLLVATGRVAAGVGGGGGARGLTVRIGGHGGAAGGVVIRRRRMAQRVRLAPGVRLVSRVVFDGGAPRVDVPRRDWIAERVVVIVDRHDDPARVVGE